MIKKLHLPYLNPKKGISTIKKMDKKRFLEEHRVHVCLSNIEWLYKGSLL